MSNRKDLTRWNRSGMSRFRYIDGNAATFLEELRQALLERFSDAKTRTLQWETLVPRHSGDPVDPYQRFEHETSGIQKETGQERINRILAHYNGERQDWGWEIMRVLARSTHVLTEYINAYANEKFLRTATQWDHVRRLVEMLDYHPAPPASALTLLVIEAEKNAAGSLEAGFQVKYTPPDGAAPVIFETLDTIGIDAALNQIRPAEYDRNQNRLEGSKLMIEDEVEDLNIGEPLVLEDEKSGHLRGYLIVGFQVLEGTTEIQVTPRLSQRMFKGYTKVHLKPKERLKPVGPAAKGTSIDRVLFLIESPAELLPGMVIYITDGVREYYRRLSSVRNNRLVFNTGLGLLRLDSARVSQPVILNVSQQTERSVDHGHAVIYVFRTAGDWSYLVTRKIANNFSAPQGKKHLPFYTVTAARYHPSDGENTNKGYTILTVSWNRKDHLFPLNNPQTLLVPAAIPGPWRVDTYLEKFNGHLPETLTASLPKKTSAGDLAVVVSGIQLAWTRLAAVMVDQTKEEAGLVAVKSWEDRGGGEFFLSQTVIYSHFRETLRLSGWRQNNTPLTGNRISLASAPVALIKGRLLLVENNDDKSATFFAVVSKIEGNNLVLSQNFPAGFTYGNTMVAGNVVSAAHGETKEEKILGGGDASLLNQSFVFLEKRVSFVADNTQPSGVKPAIVLTVDGRNWEQVPSFLNSSPADAHFTVRMTEEGYLKITFGDGKRGRRLPTGNKNIRISFRKGTGLEGNLQSGSLTKAVQSHPLVDQVRQPLPASGGNDMEGVESLRENAPATLLTLERAVSLDDFTYLAMSQSSVWQARAFSRPAGLGRNEKIEVVVVPAGGGNLGALAITLANFLLTHAVPGLELSIKAYRHRTFALEVLVGVDKKACPPDEVITAVKSALEEAFSLKKRKLGQDLFLSEIYQVVESVTGVEHSQTVINGDGTIRRVAADDRDVLTLGLLRVDYTGMKIARTETPPSMVAEIPLSKPVSKRVVGRRPVRIIQGVGTQYSGLLQAKGIFTLEDLGRLDPARLSADISPVRLNEFKTKAKLILGLDLDKSLVANLLNRSMFDLLNANIEQLSRDSGQTVPFIEQMIGKLRILQISMDENFLRLVTLRELLTEISG
jgi:hypothetical protein